MRVLGFRGPLGAFITAWGGITMLTSAPFDDWWHNAYGLDVRDPEPAARGAGASASAAIQVGVLIFVLGRLNRREWRARRVRWPPAFLSVGAMLIGRAHDACSWSTPSAPSCTARLSTAIIAAIVPLPARRRWRAVGAPLGRARIAAGFYSLFLLGLLWILPLVPARAQAGTGDGPGRTSLVPPEFPLLLIVPALALI